MNDQDKEQLKMTRAEQEQALVHMHKDGLANAEYFFYVSTWRTLRGARVLTTFLRGVRYDLGNADWTPIRVGRLYAGILMPDGRVLLDTSTFVKPEPTRAVEWMGEQHFGTLLRNVLEDAVAARATMDVANATRLVRLAEMLTGRDYTTFFHDTIVVGKAPARQVVTA